MAQRMSKEELDEQFEKFLKESLSDDSLGSARKSGVLETLGRPRKKEMKKKDPSGSPWWITDDDSEDEPQTRKFLKLKKSSNVTEYNDEVVSEDMTMKNPNVQPVMPYKPCGTTHSKALDKVSMLENFHKAKIGASLHDNDGDSTPDSPASESSDEMLGTSQSFLKSKRASQRIEEVDEDEYADRPQNAKADHGSVSISRDSLETDDSVVASGPNHGFVGVGLDTLEEQEEKERFFARLEKGASSTIDYSRLNKEMDSADSAQLAALLRNEPNEETARDDNKDEQDESKHEELSGNYSEDFEDEPDTNTSAATKKEELPGGQAVETGEDLSMEEQKAERPGMLAKVLLLDSVESTLDTQNGLDPQVVKSIESVVLQETHEMTGTGISYEQTNSEFEALRRAYHHIDQSMADTNEQKTQPTLAENEIDSFQDALNTEGKFPKNISTTESDLPTVEELMQPIRDGPVFARGFDLEPASPEAAPGRLPEPFADQPPPAQQSASTGQKTREDFLMEWHSAEKTVHSKDGGNEVLHGSSAERLISYHQEDNAHPAISKPHEHQGAAFLHENEDTHQVSNYPHKLWETYSVNNKQVTFKTKSSPLAQKKPQSRHYASVRSSGYGKTSSPVKQPPSFEGQTAGDFLRRPNLKGKMPAGLTRQKGPSSALKNVKSSKAESPVKNEIGLATSPYRKDSQQHANAITDSARSGIHLVMDGSESFQAVDNFSFRLAGNVKQLQDLDLLKKTEELEAKWQSEHFLLEHLKEELSQKENDFDHKIQEMKKQQETELLRLKQENYILQTKLHSGGEMHQKSQKVLEELKDPISEERLKEIQKEIKEQEELLQGYQQENEKLYHQVKELQSQNKKNEERMFQENRNLLAELARLKEQKANSHMQQALYAGSEQMKNHSFTELITELRTAQKSQTDLLEEIKKLKQDKQSLEVDIGQMRRERDLAKAQISQTSGDKSYEMKIMEESYKQDIFRLNKRLQWFAENQELLDKDAGRLRDANKEIELLKIEVQKLKAEAGTRSEQQQKRLKDRVADARRIQDLERQVKEMEVIIKRRHPNSLPALIYAAATASGTDETSSAKPHTTVFLEKRIQKLESELEGKDEEAKKSLRSMEQQFHKIKIQYEQRISELEQLLAFQLTNLPKKEPDQTAIRTAHEQQISNLTEVHRNTESNLLQEIERLKNRNSELEIKIKAIEDGDLRSIELQVEQANVNARLVRLNQELAAKSKEVQGLSRTVERLQKERMAMLSDHTSNSKVVNKPKHSTTVKSALVPTRKGDSETTDRFPTTLDEKAYQPDTFTDTHISEVLQENGRLTEKVERLSEALSQQKTQYQTAMAQLEKRLRRSEEDTAKHISAMKLSHQREMEKIICQHAVEHSSSKIAELSSKNSSQEIFIKHLQDQVCELQRDRESLARIQVREEILQKEMAKLLDELREAKESHTPEMRHFLALENKIKNMENRHAHRELELQQIIRQTRDVAATEQTEEAEKWRKLSHSKNQELERFRVELDSILDVLRELQRQGVVIPAPSPAPPNLPHMFWNA